MRALTSTLLARHGFTHGFSLRTGGVSEGPYASLNLGRAVGDDAKVVDENHRLFAETVGYDPACSFEVSQVHGASVHVVGPDDAPGVVRGLSGDALVAPATAPRVAVGVRVADCVPLLLADPVTGAVAAVHAGWRGTVAGVIGAAIAAMERSAGVRAEDLLAAIGPHIRAGAFEVGEDVAAQIAGAAPGSPGVIVGGYDKPHVDLAVVVRAQLAARGVLPEHVDDVGGCTVTEPERFFSFRRDGKRSGRHLGVIATPR
jgi:hypothetical protein